VDLVQALRTKRHRRGRSRVAPAALSVAEAAVVQSKQRRNVGPAAALRVAALPQVRGTPARPAASAHSGRGRRKRLEGQTGGACRPFHVERLLPGA
jgi:hypothetical protein